MSSDRHQPAINARVELLAPGDEAWLRSRVEETHGDQVVVSAPTDERGLNAVVRPGETLTLFWHTTDGPFERDVELVSVGTGTVRSWTLRPIGEPRRARRREFFRVPMSAEVELLGDHTGMSATLVDLSESGLRCHLPRGSQVAEGDHLQLALDLEESRLELTASVVRREVHQLGQEVSVEFVAIGPAQADTIRRHLFEEQRRMRRNGLA